MTMRDEFAVAALPVFLEQALLDATEDTLSDELTQATLRSYLVADAMMSSRNVAIGVEE